MDWSLVFIHPTCQDILWYSPGVCPSLGLSTKLVSRIQTEPLKLGPSNSHTTYDRRTAPINFQGKGSKITCYRLLLNPVNTIHTELSQLGPSNFVRILLMTRTNPIDFKVMGQRSRSHARR